MFNTETLEKYYKLKHEQTILKNQIDGLRHEIISGLNECETDVCILSNYVAEIKYLHETTSEFIDFLKQTNNTQLIKETASCKAYEKMKNQYHFSEEDECRYYGLRATPYLYVRKIKGDQKNGGEGNE